MSNAHRELICLIWWQRFYTCLVEHRVKIWRMELIPLSHTESIALIENTSDSILALH